MKFSIFRSHGDTAGSHSEVKIIPQPNCTLRFVELASSFEVCSLQVNRLLDSIEAGIVQPSNGKSSHSMGSSKQVHILFKRPLKNIGMQSSFLTLCRDLQSRQPSTWFPWICHTYWSNTCEFRLSCLCQITFTDSANHVSERQRLCRVESHVKGGTSTSQRRAGSYRYMEETIYNLKLWN